MVKVPGQEGRELVAGGRGHQGQSAAGHQAGAPPSCLRREAGHDRPQGPRNPGLHALLHV